MSADLRFERVVVRGFRNLTEVDLSLGPRLNVVSGDNGQGKTSLLEALYLVATSKSFRAEKTLEMLQNGAEQGSVTVSILEHGLCREQRSVLRPSSRIFFADGKRASRLASYAVRTPVVVFHPGDLLLASGPASGRRLLLDRVALFVDPASADHRARFTRAMRERQRALGERGVRAPELEAYELLAAEEGASLQRARAGAAERISAALGMAFEKMAAPDLGLVATFRPGRERGSRRASTPAVRESSGGFSTGLPLLRSPAGRARARARGAFGTPARFPRPAAHPRAWRSSSRSSSACERPAVWVLCSCSTT